MLHLEREARDWKYVYEVYIQRVLVQYYCCTYTNVYHNRAHPHFPSQFRRATPAGFLFTSRANTPKTWWEGNLLVLAEGKYIFRNVFSQTLILENVIDFSDHLPEKLKKEL